jgi:hypothetical protein
MVVPAPFHPPFINPAFLFYTGENQKEQESFPTAEYFPGMSHP